jgi:CTP:molybdopterin cytidylyltransferase MocA
MLANALAPEVDAVIPSVEGRGGHPVLLSPEFAASLRDLSWEAAAARLDVQLQRLPPERLRRVPVQDVQVRLNLNSQEAFAAWEETLDKAPSPQQ